MSIAPILKQNVGRFDADVVELGSYAYTTERLSARSANGRISRRIADIYPFAGRSILDLGCGDGAYTLEFAKLGAARVVGVDPAAAAVEAASRAVALTPHAGIVSYRVGSIYDGDALCAGEHFDCVVVRGVLHHLPDPARGVAGAAACARTVIILEPNGYNPLLKIIERTSRYHIEHEEQSFPARRIDRWLEAAGCQIAARDFFNLVPFFCPDWAVAPLESLGRLVERVRPLAALACGQYIVRAERAA